MRLIASEPEEHLARNGLAIATSWAVPIPRQQAAHTNVSGPLGSLIFLNVFLPGDQTEKRAKPLSLVAHMRRDTFERRAARMTEGLPTGAACSVAASRRRPRAIACTSKST